MGSRDEDSEKGEEEGRGRAGCGTEQREPDEITVRHGNPAMTVTLSAGL